jgi:hypothetical protein
MQQPEEPQFVARQIRGTDGRGRTPLAGDNPVMVWVIRLQRCGRPGGALAQVTGLYLAGALTCFEGGPVANQTLGPWVEQWLSRQIVFVVCLP